jgi:hypothetical protein
VTPEAVVAQERVDNYAVTNGVSRAFVSTVTIGQKTDFDIVTAPDDVLANPTYTMTRTGFQFLTEATLGVATGAAAKAPGWIGKAAFGLDTASNAAMFGEGVYNGDPLQAMFGAAGLSGNYADSIFDATAAIRNYRVRLDPDTLSSGPLPIGGLRIEKVVDNSAPSQAATLSEGATQFGRMRTAAKFLKENRYFDGTELRSLTKSQRRDIFSGIDFSKPVGVRTLDRGTELLQDVRIGGKPGPWFREPGTSASQVGLWTGGRESIRFRTTLPTQVLESRARPITDFWSQRGFSVPTEGGGTQFYTFQGYKIWPY